MAFRAFLAVSIFITLGFKDVYGSDEIEWKDSYPPARRSRDYKSELDSWLMPFYVQAEWFLNIVQLSYLDDLENRIGIEFMTFDQFWETWSSEWESWVLYLIGFTVCAAVGAVLLISMPITGSVVACCRCCGNCGGKNPPYNKTKSSCVTTGCGISLLIVTTALLFGIYGMFASNEVIKDRLKGKTGGMGDTNMLAELVMGLEDIENYFDATVDELNTTVLGGYQRGQADLFKKLDDIPNEALVALDGETGVVGNLTKLYEFTMDLDSVNESLGMVLHLYDDLDTITDELDTEISEVKADSIALIQHADCISEKCNATLRMLENLSIANNVTRIDMDTDLSLALTATDTALEDGIIQSANASLGELQKISDELAGAIQVPVDSTKQQTEMIEQDIEEFITDIDDEVGKLDFESATNALEEVQDEVDYAGTVTYWTFLTFGVIICIIVICNLVGLSIGSFCPQPRKGDRGCDCTSANGADWLMVGLTFTFIFYWIYAITVMSLFLGAGVPHTELCRHIINFNDENSMKVLDIYDRMISNALHNNTGIELEVLQIYRDCEGDISFYKALDLDDRGYNISEIIDLAPVQEALSEIKKADIQVPTVDIIDDDFILVLETLDDGLNALRFEEYFDELTKPVLTEDVMELADRLDDLEIHGLSDEAAKLRNLSSTHVEPAENLQGEIKEELKTVEDHTDVNLTEIAEILVMSNAIINDEGDYIIQSFVNRTVDDLYIDIEQFADDLEHAVRNDVGRCKDLYDAITFAVDATCVKTLYPVHAFWYSLGWILFFLIPSIIFSFKLITQYRIQEEAELTYDAFETPGNHDQWSVNGHPSSMLLKEMQKPGINQNAPDTDSGVGEFDNPLYMAADGTEFKIPRPSIVSASSDTTSADFKIPRPQVYDSNSVRSQEEIYPSSHSEERHGGANPVGDDTQL